MKNASIVSFILSTATLAFCEGLAIIGCNSDGSMSVEDHVKDLLLVSGDLDMTSFTIWTFQDRNTSNPRQIISNCSTHSPSSSSPVWFCDSTFNVMIKTDINEHTRRSHVILPDMSVGRFPDGTWRCENGGRVAECSIDVVYTPTDVQCQVTIDEDRSMVEGTCHISRMFSSHGKYSCQWFEKNGNQEEVALPSSQTQFTRSDCSEGGFVYYCGNCSFSKGLPAVSERYGYRVSILPGNISPSVEFTVKPKADAPSSPQTQLPPTSSVAVVDEDGHYTTIDINHISQANSNSSPPPVPVPHTRPSRPRDNADDDDSETVPKQPAGYEGSRGGNRALSALPASGQRENDDSNHLSIDNKSLPSEYGSGSSLSAVSQAGVDMPGHPTQQS
ncbi:uncharacterized protein [Littorina saxatilis]|uniref:uncharacterized protein isoform X3 n=1 Tax=Littorina saxatilis TaxID=31220 RepID=UPI0038B5ED06